MSYFYGDIEGAGSTAATRRGHKSTGIRAHVRSWDVGVKIVGFERDGVDYFEVWETGGSNDSGAKKLVATIQA